MPPFQEEETIMMIAAPVPTTASLLAHSPASEPNVFELPKDVAFMGILQPSLSSTSTDDDDDVVMRERMGSSLARATERAAEIKARMTRDDFEVKSPMIYEACQSSLVEKMACKLGQASLLLEDAKLEDADVTQATKNKRLSVALLSTLQYLDTLESAMAFSSLDRLNASLSSVLESITGNNKQDAVSLSVSSWEAPLLAFDFRVGHPVILSLGSLAHEPLSLPMNLEVKPIMEYSADELLHKPHLPEETSIFAVSVKKCHHQQKKYVSREGIVGTAMVKIHIAPPDETKDKENEHVWDLDEDEAKTIRIKEVRATQQNAYPTKFRINFDMYTSFVYGERGVTLTLNLETCQTVDGQVPKVQIELVVAP